MSSKKPKKYKEKAVENAPVLLTIDPNTNWDNLPERITLNEYSEWRRAHPRAVVKIHLRDDNPTEIECLAGGNHE